MKLLEDIFVLDLANNHQGSLSHAKNIINEYSKIIKKQKIKATIKFQFRNIDTLIHPEYKKFEDNKHISRFKSTKLSIDQYQELIKLIKANKLYTCCTPFDEVSVDLVKELDFDIVKIASCSAKDWPLIERVSLLNKPIIFSTGGLTLDEIDDLVSFFEHKGCDFGIMHCVSLYPTKHNDFNFQFIERLCNRYPNYIIGWSTHEEPDNYHAVKIAQAKGAKMFEKHIGLETKENKLNKYSCTPKQFEKWVESYKYSVECCGNSTKKISDEEIIAISTLLRGVYANKNLKAGYKLKKSDILFAMPYNKNQVDSGNFKEGSVLKKDIQAMNPIYKDDIRGKNTNGVNELKSAIHEVKGMLSEAKIFLNSSFEVEYSHHYGMKNFKKTGACIINCINRAYCKKIIVMLPGQNHPPHFHPKKEETFQVLHGDLTVYLSGNEKKLLPGETLLIQSGVWHSFQSKNGCIFEEVSTTHYNNDSVYKDQKINVMQRKERKTIVDHWGRFQI